MIYEYDIATKFFAIENQGIAHIRKTTLTCIIDLGIYFQAVVSDQLSAHNNLTTQNQML